MKERQVLVCRCGECARWELVEHENHHENHGAGHFDKPIEAKLRCITCKKEFDITITVPAHDHLSFVALKTAEKSAQTGA